MGPSVKLTKRLVLRVENESAATEVLKLYQRNRHNFELFEPTRPSNFYTVDYHTTMLKREYKAYSLGTFLRYYIYKASNMTRVIGAVNFNLFRNEGFLYAEIGYKLDALYQGQGLAYEACVAGIETIVKDYCVTRIDARIHPDNAASIKLAESMGFVPTCFEPASANIMGQTVDIMRYSLATGNTQ